MILLCSAMSGAYIITGNNLFNTNSLYVPIGETRPLMSDQSCTS